ncbi:hypothetical protein TSUD_192890 [Trifolium subterraneum]|uniref:Reverse transcriptase zinc-binding domain-containing protein n=1 Tax=Trifolium subterraneum TaxID=3900 RepID=A0A2Z6NP88_TRISU|nr:hypothetical protein TSUD_192890 [Trifolium subterraneum]
MVRMLLFGMALMMDYSHANQLNIRGLNSMVEPNIFKWIWRWEGPEPIRCLMWKIAHECLMTNSRRMQRSMTT